MYIIGDIAISLLITYLSFSNFLATEIDSWFPAQENTEITKIAEPTPRIPEVITSLPSRIGNAIPDILLRSTNYQKAAIIESSGDQIGASTNEPLEAIVNILCTFTTDEYVRTTTGTGFFIDPDGVIITNAHVAQFLLLEETSELGESECVVRSGNPAAPTYRAELLYLPPSWVQENAGVMHQAVPMSTGERDYALLYASETIDNSPLPARFPALGFENSLLPVSTIGESVVAAGYPAGNLLENGPSADLIPQLASTTVSELYTFGSNHADVFSIRGSAVGEQGASGGPVLNTEGNAIGMIVTRGDDQVDGPGSLRAITFSHIEQTIFEETGFSLARNVGGNLPYRADIFAETLTPFLLTLLQQESTN